MRRAYPVCPNTQARIFLQHPPTINTYPELSSAAHKSTAEFSRCSKGLSIIYLDITTTQQLYSKSAAGGEGKDKRWWLVAHSASVSSAPLRYWVIAAGAEGSDGWVVIEEIRKTEVWWHGGSSPPFKKKQLAVRINPSSYLSHAFINTHCFSNFLCVQECGFVAPASQGNKGRHAHRYSKYGLTAMFALFFR